MKRDIRVIGVKRKEIDEEKLALAFLLLARTLHDQKQEAVESATPEHPNVGEKGAA